MLQVIVVSWYLISLCIVIIGALIRLIFKSNSILTAGLWMLVLPIIIGAWFFKLIELISPYIGYVFEAIYNLYKRITSDLKYTFSVIVLIAATLLVFGLLIAK